MSEDNFTLPGCTFGSLLSPAGRSAIRIADALKREERVKKEKERLKRKREEKQNGCQP